MTLQLQTQCVAGDWPLALPGVICQAGRHTTQSILLDSKAGELIDCTPLRELIYSGEVPAFGNAAKHDSF